MEQFAKAVPTDGTIPIDVGIDLLWKSYQAPEVQAALELYCAARGRRFVDAVKVIVKATLVPGGERCLS